MNIYDTKVVACKICEKPIGEVDYDSKVINPLCGQCVNPISEVDKTPYTVSSFLSQIKKKTIEPMMVEI